MSYAFADNPVQPQERRVRRACAGAHLACCADASHYLRSGVPTYTRLATLPCVSTPGVGGAYRGQLLQPKHQQDAAAKVSASGERHVSVTAVWITV
eukprot:352948-Chlamydomonas_euryale.AAC.4